MTTGTGGLPAIGEQLGHLEYVIDDETLAAYRNLVGESGCFPNLLADDCKALLSRRCGGSTLTTIWQRFDFLRPPVLGRRVQVGGWLRDAQERGGITRFRVGAFAVDEIGTEIMRSDGVFVVGQVEPHAQPSPDCPSEKAGASDEGLGSAMPGDWRVLGRLNLPDGNELASFFETAGGLSGFDVTHCENEPASLVAGWLEGLLGRDFGDDFRWGGRLAMAYQAPLVPGHVLNADAVVLGRDLDVTGTVTEQLVISVCNQLNARLVTAVAEVKMPSPRLL